jgi:hypothetical protein
MIGYRKKTQGLFLMTMHTVEDSAPGAPGQFRGRSRAPF